MGILSRLFEKRSIYSADADYWYGNISTPTAAGVSVDEYNALEYGDVYKCIRVIAETIAMLPLHLYKRIKNNGGKDRADEHPLYNLLHIRPNSEMTKFQFFETGLGHVLSWGNWYNAIERNKMGEILNLWPLRPDRMKVTRGEGSQILKYLYTPVGQTEEIPFYSDEILHIPGLGFNGITGYSPIAMAREAIALGKAASEYAARFFGNDATPGLILKHPHHLDKKGQDNIRETISKDFTGLKNKFKFMILEENMSIEKIGIPMKDAEFLELRKFQRSEICGIYRVPPHMISDTERSTSWGTGIEQQTIGFIIYTIMPWLVRIEQAINFKLLNEKEQKKYFCEHSLQGLMRGDSGARAEYYNKMFLVGAFSINDILRLENMNPIGEEGDRHYVPLNMQPLFSKEEKEEIEQITEKIEEKPEELPLNEEKTPNLEEKSQKIEIKLLETPNETITLPIPNGTYFIPEISDNISTSSNEQTASVSIIQESSQVNSELANRYKGPEPPKIETEKVSNGFKRIWGDAVARIVRREGIAIKRAVKRKDVDSFQSYMDGFYSELPEFISSTLHPSVTSYAEMVGSTDGMRCISTYMDNHIAESKGEILKWSGVYLFSSSSDNGMRANEKAIDDCLNLWGEKRPEKAAGFFEEFFAST